MSFSIQTGLSWRVEGVGHFSLDELKSIPDIFLISFSCFVLFLFAVLNS